MDGDGLTVPLPLAQALRLADEFQQTDRLDEAKDLLTRTLQVAPRQPDALHLAGLVAFRRDRFAEAATLIEQALEHGVDSPLYWRNLCPIYERLGRYDAAEHAGRRAIALDPADASAYHNLTVVHYRRLELAASIECARQAIALDPLLPGPHFALAEALLLGGDFAEGWEAYEWRFRMPGIPQPLPHTGRPAWDGAELPNGSLLLVADQGFGDCIQFSRYIPWAAGRCARLALACSAELLPLFRPAFPDIAMFQRWEDAPAFDAWQTLSGLPRLHGTRLHNIPAQPAYLHADPARVVAWGARLGALVPPGARRIGIAWAGRPTHQNDANRSASLAVFEPVLDMTGVAAISLQKGPPAAQIGAYFGRAPLLNLGPELADFADTAALVANLDAVVAVDTSVVHLAAALGRPTTILLPFAPDWRWLLGRSDSPWYPTARLCRQKAPGEWGSAAADAATHIAG